MKKGLFIMTLLFFVGFAFAQSAISVERTGKGNTLIFLPGFTSPGSVWNETLNHLTGEYESHIVSYAGFNGLPAIDTPWYETVKNELFQHISKGDLKNITLVGHSMGGNLAIDIAAGFPERIRGLILVESIPCMRDLMMPGVPASSLQYNTPYNNSTLKMSEEDFKAMATGMAQMMTNVPSKIDELINWSVNADRKTYVYGYTDLLKLDLRETLSQIKIQTLILGASYPDKEIIKTNYTKQYNNLENKEIIIIDSSRHFIMFDQPEQLYSHINKYLDKNVKEQKTFRNAAL